MTAVAISVADAVVSLIDSGGFTDPIAPGAPSLTATREYIVESSIEDLASTRISVVPSELSFGLATRAKDDHIWSIDVGVQQRVSHEDGEPKKSDLDGLIELVQLLLDRLRTNAIDLSGAGLGQSSLIAGSVEPLWDQAMLKEKGVFMSVVRVAYVVRR